MQKCLLDTGSLTAHLVRASEGDFRVQVLAQYWGLPTLSERKRLGLGDRDWGIIREVLLICRGQPWVYARSILPARSLTGHLRRLRGLDSRPLGHILFTDPSLRRVPYELCRYPMAELPEQARININEKETPAELWGRRSCFLLADKPIMVSEIFLPAFEPWS
ncbi:chorismate lyase [Spongiibacter sp. KMU-158]|uniref:Probable chorismate pyruvate-lyase n=1 Tax=Spongiibacter pelagi TaxID=2760804 RepID=A0A927C171_9GAMM|nr:chorismate lyase [Spongiibacter pelagi]MBD2857635.1 chorismate lyase [Spongiibacter pelagi]